MGLNPLSDAAVELVKSTVGKAVDGLIGKYLPPSMSEKEKADLRMEAEKLALEEYKTKLADTQGARELAGKESEGAPGWTKVLTVTHRPAWSFAMLGIFGWTVIAPYCGFPQFPLTEVHKSIMETVIIFYFGGRSLEKITDTVKGK